MSPHDYIDLIMTTRQAGATSGMNYVALVSAFLAMSYFAGARLSTVQVWLVSGVYSIFVLFPVNAAVQDFMTTNALAAEFYNTYPEEAVKLIAETPTVWPVFVAVAIIGWLMSIAFLVNIRRRGFADTGDTSE